MVIPNDIAASIDQYLENLRRVIGQVRGVYLVGSSALGDYTRRSSNIDLVVVTTDRPDSAGLAPLAAHHRSLSQARRPPRIAYVGAEDLLGEPAQSAAISFDGTAAGSGEGLVTPMTWEILRNGPTVVIGAPKLEVWHDRSLLRTWFADRLDSRTALPPARTLLLRRRTSPAALDAARDYLGMLTGTVMSKIEAGEQATTLFSGRHRRILTDAVGYRMGESTSMYWGPLERRTDLVNFLTTVTSHERA